MAAGEHDPFSTGYRTDRLPTSIHDTAVKATMTFQYSTTPVNSAADWNAHARREVTAQSYCAVTAEHFLEKLLFIPQKDILKNIKRACTEAGLYIERDGWPSLRINTSKGIKPKERHIYPPFLEVLTKINISIRAGDRTFTTIWKNTSDESPKSQEQHTARIRPDISNLLGSQDDVNKWEAALAHDVEVKSDNMEAEKSWVLSFHPLPRFCSDLS